MAPHTPTLADLFDDLDPTLTAVLGASDVEALRARAAGPPLTACPLLIFELPPAEPGTPVDLSLGLTRAVTLRRAGAQLALTPPTRALVAALSEPDDPWWGSVDNAWLEYDVGPARRMCRACSPIRPSGPRWRPSGAVVGSVWAAVAGGGTSGPGPWGASGPNVGALLALPTT